jgi:glutathione S-transferase
VASDDLFHLALAADWLQAQSTGEYSGSAIGRTLHGEGFVHCSFAEQVRSVADRYYRDHDDVILLRVDPALLTSEVRVEPAPGTSERYPHIYGPIPLTAVMRAEAVPLDPDGRLRLPDLQTEP